MHETPKVFLTVASTTVIFKFFLNAAAKVAPKAPTAEHSTRLAIPIKKRPVIVKKIAKGIMPARKSLSFSLKGICLSSFGSVGPSSGCKRQRIYIYKMNKVAIINPGNTPASHNLLTGWRAIIPYKTRTTLGGTRIPSELPA